MILKGALEISSVYGPAAKLPSMSESVLNYKGLVEIKDLLNTMKL